MQTSHRERVRNKVNKVEGVSFHPNVNKTSTVITEKIMSKYYGSQARSQSAEASRTGHSRVKSSPQLSKIESIAVPEHLGRRSSNNSNKDLESLNSFPSIKERASSSEQEPNNANELLNNSR